MKLNIKILLYNFFFKAFVDYIVANQAALQILDGQVTKLQDLYKDWSLKFTAYVFPGTFGTPTISDINGAFNICFPYTESIKTIIKNNLLVILSGIDRRFLGIAKTTVRRGVIPVPTSSPTISLLSRIHLAMKFIALDPLFPSKKKKPTDVFSIGYKIAYVKMGSPPPALGDYVNQIPVNTTSFEMLFTSDQVGYTLYIIGYYLNARNEAGPDGAPFNIDII